MERILRSKSGFSLVELLCVVSIIGILAIIGIPQYQQYRYKAFQAEAKVHLSAIHTGERVFFMEYQGYHSSMSVVGFAPQGKTRYNVGFGSDGVITPNYTAALTSNATNSKMICSGAFGLGTDARCNMFVSTPNIAFSATVDTTSYRATAVAFESSLIAANDTHPVLIALGSIIGSEALAASGGGSSSGHMVPTGSFESLPTAGFDGWVIDQTNSLRRVLISDVEQEAPACNPGGGSTCVLPSPETQPGDAQ